MSTSRPWQVENAPTHARTLSSILVVDDEKRSRDALVSAVAARAAHVTCASSVSAAKRELERLTPELVLLDFALGDGDAFDLLDVLGALTPQPVVIIVSGEANVEQSFRLLAWVWASRRSRASSSRAVARSRHPTWSMERASS